LGERKNPKRITDSCHICWETGGTLSSPHNSGFLIIAYSGAFSARLVVFEECGEIMLGIREMRIQTEFVSSGFVDTHKYSQKKMLRHRKKRASNH
jgi:hypothetical protein